MKKLQRDDADGDHDRAEDPQLARRKFGRAQDGFTPALGRYEWHQPFDHADQRQCAQQIGPHRRARLLRAARTRGERGIEVLE